MRARRRGAFVLVAAVAMATSCGGSDDTTTLASPDTMVSTTATEPGGAVTTTGGAGETNAAPVCTSEATEIAVGSPVSDELVGTSQPPGERRYFCVEIPAEVTRITIALTAMTADLNLYVGYPDLQTVQEGGLSFWTTVDERGLDDKVIVVEPALEDFVRPGSYYIEVSANEFDASSPFTLTVEI